MAIINGDSNDNVLIGTAGDDIINGFGGADTLHGGGGNDALEGGAGADALDGGGGIDTASYYTSTAPVSVSLLTGKGTGGDAQGDMLAGFENLSGGQGNDRLEGDAGANLLQGWSGIDVLVGRGGEDVLAGGTGADRFRFTAVGDSAVGADADVITDFSQADADRIDLQLIDADAGAAGNQAFSFIGTALYSGSAGELRYVIAGGVTTIASDVDGDMVSDFDIQLAGAIALVAFDILL